MSMSRSRSERYALHGLGQDIASGVISPERARAVLEATGSTPATAALFVTSFAPQDQNAVTETPGGGEGKKL